jgi:hypothetical protein
VLLLQQLPEPQQAALQSELLMLELELQVLLQALVPEHRQQLLQHFHGLPELPEQQLLL